MAIETLLDPVTLPELKYLQPSFAAAFSEDRYSSDWWLGDYTEIIINSLDIWHNYQNIVCIVIKNNRSDRANATHTFRFVQHDGEYLSN